MATVGIYVDGPNIERGLHGSRNNDLLDRVATVFVQYSSTLGDVVERKLFLDEDNDWISDRTRVDYKRNGFDLIESKSFKKLNRETGQYIYGKSLTDPTLHCYIIERLHDVDCPDILVIATGDKDITVVLDYIKKHGKKAVVLSEAHSLASYLVEKCDLLGFPCHVLQLIARSTPVCRSLRTSQDQSPKILDRGRKN